jgi:hypothetical protein
VIYIYTHTHTHVIMGAGNSKRLLHLQSYGCCSSSLDETGGVLSLNVGDGGRPGCEEDAPTAAAAAAASNDSALMLSNQHRLGREDADAFARSAFSIEAMRGALASLRVEACSKKSKEMTNEEDVPVKNERKAKRLKGFGGSGSSSSNSAAKREKEDENNEDENEKSEGENKRKKQLGSLDERGVIISVDGDAGNGLVKIRSQFIGNEANGVRDAQVVANSSELFGRGRLKERVEVFAERARLVVVGIDDDDDEEEEEKENGHGKRQGKKGDAKRNVVHILDDEMVAGLKFMPPPLPPPPPVSVSSPETSGIVSENEDEDEKKQKQLKDRKEMLQKALKEKRQRAKTYATVRVTPTKSSVQTTVSNGYAPVHTLLSLLHSLSLSKMFTLNFDEQLVLHSNFSDGTKKALFSCRAEKEVLENNAGKIRLAQRVSVDSNGNSAKSIRLSFTHTSSVTEDDNSQQSKKEETSLVNETQPPSKSKKTRTNTATFNLREKKSRGRIKPGESVESIEQRFEKQRACTVSLRRADPHKGLVVSFELAKQLRDSVFRPKLNVVKQFFVAASINEDDDDDGQMQQQQMQQQHQQQQQTYKLSLTAASRLLETEISRKFKLTDSVEGEIVFAAKLLAARHFAYLPTRNETNNPGVVRDAMIGVYLGSRKDVL